MATSGTPCYCQYLLRGSCFPREFPKRRIYVVGWRVGFSTGQTPPPFCVHWHHFFGTTARATPCDPTRVKKELTVGDISNQAFFRSQVLSNNLLDINNNEDYHQNTFFLYHEPVHSSDGRSIKLPPSFGPSILILFPFRSIYYEKISPFLSIECEK